GHASRTGERAPQPPRVDPRQNAVAGPAERDRPDSTLALGEDLRNERDAESGDDGDLDASEGVHILPQGRTGRRAWADLSEADLHLALGWTRHFGNDSSGRGHHGPVLIDATDAIDAG